MSAVLLTYSFFLIFRSERLAMAVNAIVKHFLETVGNTLEQQACLLLGTKRVIMSHKSTATNPFVDEETIQVDGFFSKKKKKISCDALPAVLCTYTYPCLRK